MSQWWYYDFMNMNSALQQRLIKEGYGGSLHYIKDICSTAVSMFKYKNIEKIPNLTNEILEMAIMFNYNLCFYKHPALGIILCRFVYNSVFNEYMKPDTVNLLALNGQSIAENVPYKDIVLVRDNSMNIIPFIPIMEYIRKIEMVDTSVFRVLEIASLPLAIVGNKKVSNQLKAIAKTLGSKDSFIVGDDSILDSVKGFNIDVPVNPLDLYKLKTQYRNECLASIGIYSTFESKERKVVSEIVANNDYTDHIYQDKKTQRLAFIEGLNKLDSSLGIELVETYMINVKDDIKEKADLEKAIAIAQNSNKEGQPND